MKTLALFLFALLQVSLYSTPARAVETCREVSAANARYTICSFDPAKIDLSMAWKKSDGSVYGSFAPLAAEYKKRKTPLLFASSGGPFHFDLTPTGLYVENFKELTPAIAADATGIGSFYEKPNGMFFVEDGRPKLLTTERYLATKPKAAFATQSGPMLLIDGEVNKSLNEQTAPLRKRTGVCLRRDTPRLVFAITDTTVTVQAFADFLKSQNCQNALMLDTSTSSFYVPSRQRADLWVPIGPIIAITQRGSRS